MKDGIDWPAWTQAVMSVFAVTLAALVPTFQGWLKSKSIKREKQQKTYILVSREIKNVIRLIPNINISRAALKWELERKGSMAEMTKIRFNLGKISVSEPAWLASFPQADELFDLDLIIDFDNLRFWINEYKEMARRYGDDFDKRSFEDRLPTLEQLEIRLIGLIKMAEPIVRCLETIAKSRPK